MTRKKESEKVTHGLLGKHDIVNVKIIYNEETKETRDFFQRRLCNSSTKCGALLVTGII